LLGPGAYRYHCVSQGADEPPGDALGMSDSTLDGSVVPALVQNKQYAALQADLSAALAAFDRAQDWAVSLFAFHGYEPRRLVLRAFVNWCCQRDQCLNCVTPASA
jgi:hypothetical protein